MVIFLRRALLILLLSVAVMGSLHGGLAGAQQGAPLDINMATAAQLTALPGMGPVYARRVVEGRPYTAKNQLVTRGILPQAVYAQIRDRIVAHRIK